MNIIKNITILGHLYNYYITIIYYYNILYINILYYILPTNGYIPSNIFSGLKKIGPIQKNITIFSCFLMIAILSKDFNSYINSYTVII